MIPPEFHDVFRRNFLVCGLPDSVIDEVAGLASYAAGVAGDALIKKGEKSGDLLVILEGKAAVYSPKGDKLAEVGPGGVIGEVALVDDQPRSADVVCVGMVKHARLPAGDLRRYMATEREAGFVMLANLARVLSMRLRNAAIVLEELKEKAAQDPWKYAT